MSPLRNTTGISVIEVLIAIGITAVLIVSIGASQGAIHRLTTASEDNQATLSYARESLESVTAAAQTVFGCSCSTEDCTTVPGQCKRISDGATCTLLPGYTTCWTEYADGVTTNAPLHITDVAGTPALSPGEETITADGRFSRAISIENIDTNADRKKITVDVTWTERGVNKSTSLETIVTAWENI